MTDLSDAPNTVIQVKGLTKHYGDLKAVDGISFGVERGEVFGILGPNGAGKTTTLECIEGLLEPTSGTTGVLGIDTQRDPQRVKERIGVQLQASAYFDYLTLKEILDLFGMFYDRRVEPLELLEQVNLADRANTTVNKLSGGQQQRFTIAATLVNDPEVVFLDEPTTGLDPQARRSLWEFVQEINEAGRTVVLTTHYMEEAEFLCDRIAIMDRGKIVALDTPVKLVRSLPVPYQIRLGPECLPYLDEMRRLAAVQDAVGEDSTARLLSADASITVPALMEWAAGSDVKLTHLEVVPSNLEDVFLSITGRALRE
ncbi:MAG: ABC transporter ATP-binding protein [Chloroflexi bacterium]|nr:ABC transporter ATP-binding protein [Chloroflexota bacterium]